jgi:hypothetical protein
MGTMGHGPRYTDVHHQDIPIPTTRSPYSPPLPVTPPRPLLLLLLLLLIIIVIIIIFFFFFFIIITPHPLAVEDIEVRQLLDLRIREPQPDA